MKIFGPKFGVFGRTYFDEKIFGNFLTVKNLGFTTDPHRSFATTPQPVNRIESKFFQIESNRIRYQLNRPLLLHGRPNVRRIKGSATCA